MTIRIETFQEEQHSLPTNFGFVTHYPTLLRMSARCCLGDQGLTPREQQIAALLVQGLSVKEIARRLEISPSTVNNHAGRIYEKLGVSGRRELGQRMRG
jgi:DNA-binding CsgD family transcriptional regulator